MEINRRTTGRRAAVAANRGGRRAGGCRGCWRCSGHEDGADCGVRQAWRRSIGGAWRRTEEGGGEGNGGGFDGRPEEKPEFWGGRDGLLTLNESVIDMHNMQTVPQY
ncbi:uncharacterized protein A4U43_C05F19070 [Asparagus officinalis]|uniref:Uncharacterized protein n=1 Tax=Asparagus officinalis TaxID=4686 RepID=A0A5P1EWL6_ASPOF|nr:uncharacterized protein A4U43_C05F19070 [Asparagus officinalis]